MRSCQAIVRRKERPSGPGETYGLTAGIIHRKKAARIVYEWHILDHDTERSEDCVFVAPVVVR